MTGMPQGHTPMTVGGITRKAEVELFRKLYAAGLPPMFLRLIEDIWSGRIVLYCAYPPESQGILSWDGLLVKASPPMSSSTTPNGGT